MFPARREALRAMDLEPLLDTLLLGEVDRDALRAAVASAPLMCGLRRVWLVPFENTLREEAAHGVPSYERFANRLGRAHVFAWMPLAHALLAITRLTTLMPGDADDHRPLEVRTNAFVEHGTRRVLRTRMLRALRQAWAGELKTFLEMSTQRHDLFYNHGRARVETRRPGCLAVRYEGHHPAIARYFAPGYFRGVAREFDLHGEVRFVAPTPDTFEILFEAKG